MTIILAKLKTYCYNVISFNLKTIMGLIVNVINNVAMVIVVMVIYTVCCCYGKFIMVIVTMVIAATKNICILLL